MMLEALEKRFKAMRASQPVEHLSDNGSAYTARETRLFAVALNLVRASHLLPVHSQTACPSPS